MSRATDLADAEAARAEAEPPDTGDDDEAEAEQEEEQATPYEPPEQPPEQPPPTEAPTSEADIAKRFEKLEREAVRHSNRVAEIMGEDAAQLVPCPLCFTPGFCWPPELAPLSAEQQIAVRVMLGEPPEPEMRQAVDKETCDECGGDGLTVPLVSLPPSTERGPDAWGRPGNHPHWGQNPATVGV
jgi:hypothetical protein